MRIDNRKALCKSIHLAVCQFIWVKDGKDKRQTPVEAALARYQKEQGITFTHNGTTYQSNHLRTINITLSFLENVSSSLQSSLNGTCSFLFGSNG